jgi:iron complex transport system ATP-binding protein
MTLMWPATSCTAPGSPASDRPNLVSVADGVGSWGDRVGYRIFINPLNAGTTLPDLMRASVPKISVDESGSLVGLVGIGVSYDAKQTWALQQLSMAVRPGERWAVLGPNGCGKTTLVQLITGYLHPTVGDLSLLGARLGRGVDWRVLRTRLGVVSAAFAKMVRPELLAAEVVMTAKYAALEPWWHEYSAADRERARALLDAGGFGYLASRPFGVLSEGERQQVQLARSLMTDPDLLVLDEPAAGLDLGARERLVARIAAIAADPARPAVVLITHHVEEIPPGFTHALLLRSGQTVASGPISETMRSSSVSEAFGVDVSLTFDEGRFAARVRL